MERAERSGGLHKRSAEAWGYPLRTRGAELPLGAFAIVLQKIRDGVAAGTGSLRRVAKDLRIEEREEFSSRQSNL